MVGLGQKGVVRVGGNCLKYLKKGWNRKEGKGNKDLIKGGRQAGPRSGCLKKGGLEPPHELWTLHFLKQFLILPNPHFF